MPESAGTSQWRECQDRRPRPAGHVRGGASPRETQHRYDFPAFQSADAAECLYDKAKAYPAQLSGGQQQRVAIARVLASTPEILLCDEATSALDPQTTQEVLDLLKEINREYGITIVVITHAMSVIEEICDRVGVLEKGRLVEIGAVKDVFTNPSTDAAKRLLLTKRSEELLLESEKGR